MNFVFLTFVLFFSTNVFSANPGPAPSPGPDPDPVSNGVNFLGYQFNSAFFANQSDYSLIFGLLLLFLVVLFGGSALVRILGRL